MVHDFRNYVYELGLVVMNSGSLLMRWSLWFMISGIRFLRRALRIMSYGIIYVYELGFVGEFRF